jgi:hypothetical protein
VHAKPSFETIFRLTGVHLGAAAIGFVLAATLFAPRPRQTTPLPERTLRILELREQARAASSAASVVAVARATELCKGLDWPACDADSIRAMGSQP